MSDSPKKDPPREGGNAFPAWTIAPDWSAGGSGMTLRDYFAAAALTGLASRPDPVNHCPRCGEIQRGARQAWAIADAMLAERAKAQDGAR